MIRKLREARENEEGFTLIELLVVVIIIGILAAIAIPAFLGQRENARRGAAESDARNAAIGIESALTVNDSYPGTASTAVTMDNATSSVWYVDENGDFSSAAPTTTTARAEITISSGVTLVYTLAADGESYTIVASHDQVEGGVGSITYNSATGGLADTWSTSGGAGTPPAA